MATEEPEKKKKKPAKTKPAKTLAILGRSRRTGRWRLARRSNVLAVFGAVHLDMRKSFADDDDKLTMKVTVLFGSAVFILPFGAEVRPSGTSILASSMVDVPEHDDPSELPTIDVEWTAMFGRLRIVTEIPSEAATPEVADTAIPEPVPTEPDAPPPTAPAAEVVADEASADQGRRAEDRVDGEIAVENGPTQPARRAGLV